MANDTSNHESIMTTLPGPIPVIGQTRGRMYKLKSYTYIGMFCRPFPTSGYPNLYKQYRRYNSLVHLYQKYLVTDWSHK